MSITLFAPFGLLDSMFSAKDKQNIQRSSMHAKAEELGIVFVTQKTHSRKQLAYVSFALWQFHFDSSYFTVHTSLAVNVACCLPF